MTRCTWLPGLLLVCSFAVVNFLPAAIEAAEPKLFKLSARASQIDPEAKEHPEIDFVFSKNGKPTDVEHAFVDTRVPAQGKLVIWLMGHNEALFERLSSYGLHAIQVHYANGWFSKLNREPPPDDQYLGRIRLEAATGEDFSDQVSIPKADGIKVRALRFVQWLAKENPEGKWNQFIDSSNEDLIWSKVTLAGISHGSTTAARFAKHQAVDRVVMLSGPRDQLENWQSLPSATPANRYFGFTHVLDTGWTGDHYCRSWELLGLHQFGPLVEVEKNKPPYGNSRRLISNADVNNDEKRAHSGAAPGGSAIKNKKGEFIHEPVWRYLFTHPVDQVGEPSPLDNACRHDLSKK